MNKEIQATPMDWKIIPEEHQKRIITIVGKLVQRKIESELSQGVKSNDWYLPKPDIDSRLQQWESKGEPHRTPGNCLCEAIDPATSREAPGIYKTSVRFGNTCHTFRMVEKECVDNR